MFWPTEVKTSRSWRGAEAPTGANVKKERKDDSAELSQTNVEPTDCRAA
jgi:hypothetical protein